MKAPEKLFLPKDICAYDNAVECFVSRTQLHKSDVEYTRSDLCMVWRPIADAPRDGEEVFLYGKGCGDFGRYDKEIEAFTFNGITDCKATHFMLIKPPEVV